MVPNKPLPAGRSDDRPWWALFWPRSTPGRLVAVLVYGVVALLFFYLKSRVETTSSQLHSPTNTTTIAIDNTAPRLITLLPEPSSELELDSVVTVMLVVDEPIQSCLINGQEATVQETTAKLSLVTPIEGEEWAVTWDACDRLGNQTGLQSVQYDLIVPQGEAPYDSTWLSELQDSDACAALLSSGAFMLVVHQEAAPCAESELISLFSPRVPRSYSHLATCLRKISSFCGSALIVRAGGGTPGSEDGVAMARMRVTATQVEDLARRWEVSIDHKTYRGCQYLVSSSVIGYDFSFDPRETVETNRTNAMMDLVLDGRLYDVDIAIFGDWIVCARDPQIHAVIDRLQGRMPSLRAVEAFSTLSQDKLLQSAPVFCFYPASLLSTSGVIKEDLMSGVRGGAFSAKCGAQASIELALMAITEEDSTRMLASAEAFVEGWLGEHSDVSELSEDEHELYKAIRQMLDSRRVSTEGKIARASMVAQEDR